MSKIKKELREREKELDCLYHLTPLLTSYSGSEEPLLSRITLELTKAMTDPLSINIDLVLESRMDCNLISDSTDLFTATALNKEERLSLYLRFTNNEDRLDVREKNLLLSVVDLTAAAVQRLRNEASIKEKNTTLTELLTRLQMERDKDAEGLQIKMRTFLFPLLNQLHQSVPDKSKKLISLIQSELEEITNIGRDFNSLLGILTPRELEICSFVAKGIVSKEIADSLNISIETVERHRCTIRKKLEINNKAINLQSYLTTL